MNVDDAIAMAASLTDIQKMTAEFYDDKFPLLQPSIDHICKSCKLVSHMFLMILTKPVKKIFIYVTYMLTFHFSTSKVIVDGLFLSCGGVL